MAKNSYPIDESMPNGHGKRNLAIGGTAAGVPGYLYARGLRQQGGSWKGVPGAAWGQIKGRQSYAAASALRAGTIGTWKDVSSIGPRVWGHLKGVGKGLAGKALSSDARLIQLSAKLDRMIQLETAAERFNRAHSEWVNSPEFQQNVRETRKKILIGAGGAAGVSAVGLAGHGLYKRGLQVKGAGKRGIPGNILAGARLTADRLAKYGKIR